MHDESIRFAAKARAVGVDAVICDPEKVNDRGRYQGVPTLIFEALSESTRNKDMLKKLNLYMAGGVGEYWIIRRTDVQLPCSSSLSEASGAETGFPINNNLMSAQAIKK